jgi:hypothetical protein
LDPFGLFGAFISQQNKERMVEHYGFIPSDSGTQNIRGISTFLSDFVLNVGPLARENGGYDDVERAVVGEQLPLMPFHTSSNIVTVPEEPGPSIL